MEMIQQDKLVIYECPNCGYIIKDKIGEKIDCPKCRPNFKGWVNDILKKNQEKVIENPCPCGTQRCYPDYCTAYKKYHSNV